MLLRHLYDFAQSRHLLDDLAFAPKAVRWVIRLDQQGKLIGVGPLETTGDGKRGKEFSCPRTSRPKDPGDVAEFLADNLTAVFGLEPDGKPLTTKHSRKHDDFWQQIQRAALDTKHPGLQAMLEFHKLYSTQPPFLRWGVSKEAKPEEKSAWWITTAAGAEGRLGPDNSAFEVDGQMPVHDESTVRPYWRRVYAQEIADKETAAARGVCLVTGATDRPIATTHLPKIKGVAKTRPTANLVSFDKAAFASYGLEKSHNAPVSIEAVLAYTNALNWLLRRQDHSIHLGQTTLCFWARESEAASSFFAKMLSRPDPKAIADFVKSPWTGITRELARHDLFFSVTLAGDVSGTAARITVRHWMQATLEQACLNLARWFEDLNIMTLGDPAARAKRRIQKAEAGDVEEMPPLALFRLACATVRDAKDIQPEVPAQLYRAALEGTAPSLRLLKPILSRLEADLCKYGEGILETPIPPRIAKAIRDARQPMPPPGLSRMALLKLILNRKETEPMMQPEVCDTDDPAYNSGRLLAILSDTQQKAHDYKLEGAGVAERYFGTASVSPASVFPLLLRLNRHHLKKISKSERFAGHERFIEDAIQNVLVRFKCAGSGQPPMFPRTLDLHAQGRFALGFYQQKAKDDAARRSKPDNNQTPKEDKPNE